MAADRRQEDPGGVGFPRRGEIHLVEFDPARGHEFQKTRPALIVQNDVGNRYSSITIVAAITSRISAQPYPIEVLVQPDRSNGLSVQSSIRLDQIRTVDKTQLVKRLGRLDGTTMTRDGTTMTRVDEALRISLALSNV